MSIKDREPPRRLTPAEEFGLTERERLFDKVSHERFLEILDDSKTKVHRIEESPNSFGEYLFVTFSRPGKQKRIFMTFYGLGYHEYQEKWITQEWNWYQSVRGGELEHESVPRQAAKQQIQARYQEMQGYASRDTQTRQGQLFEMIADVFDNEKVSQVIEEK